MGGRANDSVWRQTGRSTLVRSYTAGRRVAQQLGYKRMMTYTLPEEAAFRCARAVGACWESLLAVLVASGAPSGRPAPDSSELRWEKTVDE